MSRPEGSESVTSSFHGRPDDRAEADGTNLEDLSAGACDSDTEPNTTPPPGGPPATDPDGSDAPPLPSTIGKYRVLDRFPRSGQAQVFRVLHPELHRELVLKLANRPVAGDGRAGVAEEGRRLADLEHPNIVRVHDLDFHDGRPYLVMEFIRGRTLSQYAREERIAPRRAAAIVAGIAGAVEFAHRRGIVHQDIKPANVLIDEKGQPRLIDFGLASRHDAWIGTPEMSEGGTFAYMAPEQARAEVDRVRTLSDVFALGGLLYFLLTGKAPFEAPTPDASWRRACRCDLDLSALRAPGIPRGLARICARAMASEPPSRIPSADAFRRALERQLLIRRTVPAITAAAVAPALLVPAGLAWLRTAPTPPAVPIPIVKEAPAPVVAAPAVPDDARVLRFEIAHYPRANPSRIGLIGASSFLAREEDDVTVQAELSRPAYSYLVAFRPDGTDELCDPDDEDTPPALESKPSYPPPDQDDVCYRLSEGPGLYAFALIVSREPLPSYREWKRRVGPLRWAAKPTCEPGVVWRDDESGGLQVLLADSNAGTRGKGSKARHSGGPAAELARWLRGLPQVHGVTLEAFPVAPAVGR